MLYISINIFVEFIVYLFYIWLFLYMFIMYCFVFIYGCDNKFFNKKSFFLFKIEIINFKNC